MVRKAEINEIYPIKNRCMLRRYGIPSYCDVLSIEINNKIRDTFIIFFFRKIFTLQHNAMGYSVNRNMKVMCSKLVLALIIFTFPKNLKRFFYQILQHL